MFSLYPSKSLGGGFGTKIEDWEFSSFKDFIGLRNGTLINKERALNLMELTKENLYNETYQLINSSTINKVK